MHLSLSLKIGIIVFATLFFINWVCTLSAQKFRGFRWGDYLLIFFFGILIFSRLPELKNFAQLLPDTLEIITLRPRQQVRSIKRGVNDTQETVGFMVDYAKGLIKKDLNTRMNYEPPE